MACALGPRVITSSTHFFLPEHGFLGSLFEFSAGFRVSLIFRGLKYVFNISFIAKFG